MSTTLSLRIPEETLEQLGQLAEATGKSRNFLAGKALQDFIAREAWQVAEIQQALKEADAGDFASDKEMAALDAKWGYRAG